jgi:aspartyl protease family protein
MIQSPDSPRKIGITMLILAWLVLFGLLAVFFDDWLDEQQNPNQLTISNSHDTIREVKLLPNRQHHYVVDGLINNQPVVFLLDTGATDVVVPQALAQKLRLPAGRTHYVSTANGSIAVFNTQLDSLQIGSIRLQNIRASINPSMANELVLLGMSALRQIEFSQEGDALILRQ